MKFSLNTKITDAIRCPHCKGNLSLSDGTCFSLVCDGAKKHCFDVSSSGYVNFALPSKSGGGDAPEAVKAREEFLALGLYEPIRDAVCAAARKYGKPDGFLVDAGCGEGYYSQKMSEDFYVFGADISKSAVNTAAKREKREGCGRAFYSVASVFELPVKDGAANVITNLFAPCAEAEYERLLASDGVLIAVYAGEDHLMGLKEALYDNVRKNQERADLPVNMECIDEIRVSFDIKLDGTENIKRLFAMTPYYWRTSSADAQRLYELESLETKVDVVVAVYKKRDRKDNL